jgi:hypothetical protein
VDYAGPEWAAKPWRFRWMPRWAGKERKSKARTSKVESAERSRGGGAAGDDL